MKPSLRNQLLAAALIGATQIPVSAQITGLRQIQNIPLAPNSGEVVSFSPNQDTLAVADNPAGGVRLLRHNGTSFANHAMVDIAGFFTANPVSGFTFSEVTGVALDSGLSGIGAAAVINGSTVSVTIGGTPTNLTTSVPQIGRVAFFNLETGAVIGSLPAGYHPDMVTIKNGKVAIANEGQHAWSGVGGSGTVAEFDAYQQPGSITVIDLGILNTSTLGAALGTLTVNTLDFSTVPALIAGLRDHTSFDAATPRRNISTSSPSTSPSRRTTRNSSSVFRKTTPSPHSMSPPSPGKRSPASASARSPSTPPTMTTSSMSPTPPSASTCRTPSPLGKRPARPTSSPPTRVTPASMTVTSSALPQQ